MPTDQSCQLVPELYCTHLQTSLRFYCDVLGFAIAYQRPKDGFTYFTRGGARLMIEEIHPGSERTWLAAALERPFGRGINLQISVQQVEALYTAVKAATTPIFWPLEDKWY